MLARKLLEAAGNAGGESLYVEDVFSTYLYTGNGTSQTITNGIDLSGEGGLTWIKNRSASENHYLWDTERGNDSLLFSNLTIGELTGQSSYFTFNADGFSLPTVSYNNSSVNYASWTFRKAEKFFDIVEYTGNGTAGRTVAHNLGSTPAVIIVKNITTNGRNWVIYHESLGNTKALEFTTGAAFTFTAWNNTSPTATEFTLGADPEVNANGETMVAYLFASDAGGFGDDGSESIIKCGSLTTDSSGLGTINLGFEPQYMLMKRADVIQNWYIWDTMRGWTVSGETNGLVPNASSAEVNYSGGTDYFHPTATGADFVSNFFGANANVIYIAIRRPMKTPESGTEVCNAVYANNTQDPEFTPGFVTDWGLYRAPSFPSNTNVGTRLLGQTALATDNTAAEYTSSPAQFDYMDGWYEGSRNTYISWNFKRATGFFDVVAYTGTGATHVINHNLGVTPELIIVKGRSFTVNWLTWHTAYPDNYMLLNSNLANQPSGRTIFDSEDSSSFTLGSNYSANGSGQTFIAYLFATLPGISKVGSYTGTASTLQINCGFSTGARFVLIKRTDSTGDWYVYDSTRGIVTGNDPYLRWNSTAAEITTTDYIDPLSSGFTVTASATGTINVFNGTYIFLAIA